MCRYRASVASRPCRPTARPTRRSASPINQRPISQRASALLNVALIVALLGYFGTTINTPDNVLTIVGNNRIFSETIQNFSANAYRRVDLTATINNAVDHHEAIRILKARLARIPNVLTTPAPDVDVLQFTPAGPVPFGAAGFPAPVPMYALAGQAPAPPPGALRV